MNSAELENKTFVTLKWGTLKAWNLKTEKALDLMNRYIEIGANSSAMLQHDTPEQKELLCALIDECDGDQIFLDWDGKYVSKEEAKKYVMEYKL